MSGTLQADFLQPQSNAGLSILNPSGNTVMASINSAGIFSSTGSLLVANTGNVFSTGNVTASGTITSNTLTSNTLVLTGSTSGSVSLVAPAIAGSNTATLPAATGTVMVSGNMPAFSVYLSSNQTVLNNSTLLVPFDTKEFDTASCFSTSTYRFTPNVAGYYQLNACVELYNGGSGEVQLLIQKNGSTYKIPSDLGGSATVWSQAGSILAYANGTTDYFTVSVYQNTGGSKTLGGAIYYTYFNGALVRTA